MASEEAIAVLGGTFDPPHLGHLALARGVADELGLARVVLVPTGNPHFKLGEDVTSAPLRMEMTRLLAAEDSRLAVSDIEASRPGVTYTVDTLTQVKHEHAAAHIYFIVGGDCAEHIMRWRRADELARLCTVIAVARPGYDFATAKRNIEASNMGFDVRYLHLDTPDVSSTAIRDAIAAGERLDGLVPASVEAFIKEHGLYRETGQQAVAVC